MLLYLFIRFERNQKKRTTQTSRFTANPNEKEKREVAANFIIFYENKCAKLWQFNEIICFSLAFSISFE